MSQLQDADQFDALCQKYSVWVISFSSPHRQTPVFLIWYTDTDENNTDRLLTNQSGDIVAIESLTNLIEILQNEQPKLTQFEHLEPWLSSVKGLEPVIKVIYDMGTLTTSIANKRLNLPTIESLVNWINLLGDYVSQDERNSYLEPYWQDAVMKKAWNYYYDCIFWPRYNDKVKLKTGFRPPLLIDTGLLVERLSASIDAFDTRIQLVRSADND